METIKVSVCCTTYNQEDYIAEAIESFLMQKTTFAYEIIIHDDASTDRTAEIIKGYAKKFPDKITAILQKENQYSKQVKIGNTFIYPIAKGKYYASCEGDDYWTDSYKLQKQYEYMESHPECTMCIHNAYIVTEDKSITFVSNPISKVECDFGIEEAIMGVGIRVATNSFFCRADILKGEYPQFVKIAPAGDYVRPILMALNGSIHYMPEKMSAHRMLAKNSFSSTMGSGKESTARWTFFYDKLEEALDSLDEYTGFQYSEIIRKSLYKQKFENYLLTRNTEELKKDPYKVMLKESSLKVKVRYFLPRFFGRLQKIHYWGLKKLSCIKK